MSDSGTKVRVCQACGEDCSGQPRIKDKKGRYLHKACYEKAVAKAKKRLPVEVQAPRPRPRPAAAVAPAASDDIYGLESGGLADDGLGLGGDDVFADLPTADADTVPCPGCGSGVAQGAILCTVCGHNFQTGRSAGKVKVSKETGLGNATKATASTSAAWLLALIGASIGGFIGAFAWALVALLFNLEHGYIAVGVGFLCGLGAAIGAQSKAGTVTGLVASGVAILAIAVGKFAAVQATVDGMVTEARESMQAQLQDPNRPWFTDEEAMLEIADDEAVRRERRGEKLRWPMGKGWEEAYELNDYPTDITTKVKMDWAKLSLDERNARKDALMRENAIESIAYEIAWERSESGQAMSWPSGMTIEQAYMFEDFPKDIVDEAGAKWDGMTRAEQAAHLNEKVEQFAAILNNPEFTAAMMSASYTGKDLAFDALWIILAVVVAFGTGANAAGKEAAA